MVDNFHLADFCRELPRPDSLLEALVACLGARVGARHGIMSVINSGWPPFFLLLHWITIQDGQEHTGPVTAAFLSYNATLFVET